MLCRRLLFNVIRSKGPLLLLLFFPLPLIHPTGRNGVLVSPHMLFQPELSGHEEAVQQSLLLNHCSEQGPEPPGAWETQSGSWRCPHRPSDYHPLAPVMRVLQSACKSVSSTGPPTLGLFWTRNPLRVSRMLLSPSLSKTIRVNTNRPLILFQALWQVIYIHSPLNPHCAPRRKVLYSPHFTGQERRHRVENNLPHHTDKT